MARSGKKGIPKQLYSIVHDSIEMMHLEKTIMMIQGPLACPNKQATVADHNISQKILAKRR